MTMDELKRSFQKEQSTHGRTTEHLHKCRVQSQNDDRALDRGQADLKSDAVAAVLEDRASPNPELEKKLVVLQKAALRSREALETAIEAEQIQRKKVDALAAEIEKLDTGLGKETGVVRDHVSLGVPGQFGQVRTANMIGGRRPLSDTLYGYLPKDLVPIRQRLSFSEAYLLDRRYDLGLCSGRTAAATAALDYRSLPRWRQT